MYAKFRGFINRHTRLKALLKRLLDIVFPNRSVSSHYVPISSEEALRESSPLRESWMHEDIPARQRQLVEHELAQFRLGQGMPAFDVLVRCLKELGADRGPLSLLEIGCSSGYYGEVFQIRGLNVTYSGCDFSESFIKLAQACYPQWPFTVADATKLHHGDATFDVAISGCCLLHIPKYQLAVSETARVARQYAIFHRTPVVIGQPNKYFRKKAYGIETVEIHFNEPEFLALLEASGLTPIATHTLNESVVDGIGSAVRTYVCRKKVS